MTTPKIMPLEETTEAMGHLRNEAERERDANIRSRNKARSSIERALYNEGVNGWDEHVKILTSALHHLEAGKRDSERYGKLRAHAEAEFVQIEGHGFSGYFEEGKDLDAAMDCLPEPSTAPTNEKG